LGGHLRSEQTLVGELEQLGCWIDPNLPDGQAANLLHHFVVNPLVDVLSVKQEN